MKVRDAMSKDPVTVPVEATVQQVASTMDRSVVGAVVIVDGDRPVGLVTDRDLVVRVLARRLPGDSRVDGVMSAGVVCVDADAELGDVVEILSAHSFRRVPVVSDDRVIGMVTLDDLLPRLAHDLYVATKSVTAQRIHGHQEPQPPMMAG